MGVGLYIHIPFCKRKCSYCDFNSGPYSSGDLDRYVVALKKEASLYSEAYGKVALETVFIGGGTPTVLEPQHILEIGDLLERYFDVTQIKEFSFEANPESVSIEKAKAFKHIGANRVSIGLQTANDDELFAISRIHDWQTFLNAYRLLRNTGFDNINIDLMIGLPGQTRESYKASLEKVLALEPEHISNYGLILEEDTPLAKKVENGEAQVLSGEQERLLYHEALEILAGRGYELYEISNFAKSQKYCLHNLNYWRCKEYLALGVGAHGYYKGVRFENEQTLEAYEKALSGGVRPILFEEELPLREQEKEYVMLGLRMAEGINIKAYEALFGKNLSRFFEELIKKYKGSGHLKQDSERIWLTSYGMDISNTIIIECFELLDESLS